MRASKRFPRDTNIAPHVTSRRKTTLGFPDQQVAFGVAAIGATDDDELLAAADGLWSHRRRVDARMLALLMEIEDRHLELRAAYRSIYDLCKRRYGMSDGAAARRARAVHMIRRFPTLSGALEREQLTLSSMTLLDGHLTAANLTSLVAGAAGKSAEAVKHLLASRAPLPDVPTHLSRISEQASLPVTTTANDNEVRRARFEPLGEERFALRTTISRSLHDKLERAHDLMSHRVRNGDLAMVMEAAVDLLLTKLEKARLGAAVRARTRSSTSRSKAIARAVRREVFERDGDRCTYESGDGARCNSQRRLELDHVVARARGGGNEPDNLRVRCDKHNFLHAVEDFGRLHMASAIRERREAVAAEASIRGALANLGFNPRDASTTARRVVEERGPSSPLPDLLRAAIVSLTAA